MCGITSWHLIGHSLAMICLAQFHDKGFPNGSVGIHKLMTMGEGKAVLAPELQTIGSLKKEAPHHGILNALKAFEKVDLASCQCSGRVLV